MSADLAKGLEERFCAFEIRGAESLGESAANRCEESKRPGCFTLVTEQLAEIHDRAKFQG
jgi:hypothetical protein